jgi:allantoin racemase
MRIVVINPNTTQAMTDDIRQAAESAAAAGTEIIAVTPEIGPESIEGYLDHVAADIAVVREVIRAERHGGADAYITACYGDPGLHACREITAAPVVGVGEASMYMAAVVAPLFSIISILERCNYSLYGMIDAYGMRQRCVSVRATPLTVLDAVNDPGGVMAELTRAGELAIKEDGAEALLLGCAGMVTFTEELESELGLPVFDGVRSAVKMAEALVSMKKKTSKIRTYAQPEPKRYIGLKEIIPYMDKTAF